MQQRIAEFDIKDMLPIALTIVVVGIGVTYGLDVVGDIKDDLGDDACAANGTYNDSGNFCYKTNISGDANQSSVYYSGREGFDAANDTTVGLAKLPEKLPTIVTVIVAALIIGILVRYLIVRM